MIYLGYVVPYLDYVVPGSIIFPTAAFLLKFKNAPMYLKLLFYYLIVSWIVNAAGVIMAQNNKTNLLLIHFQAILDSFFLLWFKYFIRNKVVVKIIHVLVIILPLLCVVNLLFIQRFDNFPSYTRTFVALLLIALCMLYWWQESEENIQWTAIPANWFVTGLLSFFAGAFFIFLFSNYLYDYVSNRVMIIAWYTNATLIMVMYILIAIGFLKWKKQ